MVKDSKGGHIYSSVSDTTVRDGGNWKLNSLLLSLSHELIIYLFILMGVYEKLQKTKGTKMNLESDVILVKFQIKSQD